MRNWQGICLSAVLLVTFAGACRAQSVTPEDEYKKLIKVDQDIQPLGDNPFGEQISLYDGTLSFEQTDISLSGNGPLIQISRSLSTTDPSIDRNDANRPFGDWDLNIPRIETATPDNPDATHIGWEVEATNPLARCTNFQAPPDTPGSQPGSGYFGADQYWYGYHLIIPGVGDQALLPRDTLANNVSPTMSGLSFPIVTKQSWMIHCGVVADDGGEGFVAIAPDGTQYTFSHLVYRPMAGMTKTLGSGPQDIAAAVSGPHPLVAPFDILYRREALMMVTQVQDRFGNTVSYHYDSSGRLDSISASDGRSLTLQYVSSTSPLISAASVSSASAGTRTWNYSYDYSMPTLPSLTGVQLPDGSAWTFDLSPFQTALVTTEFGDCSTNRLAIMSTGGAVGTIIHPSGLKGMFTLKPMMHGRSYVFKDCFGDFTTGPDAPFAIIPEVSYQQTIVSKVLSGAGLPSEIWTYSYSPANQSWTTDACAVAGTCPTTVYTDVVDPEGHDVRSTFSNRFDASEGLLLRTDYFSSSNTSPILRAEVNNYANPVGGPWPTGYGLDLQDRDNRAQTQEVSPLSQRVITQNGDIFTWQATGFDAYTQPTDVKRYSSITGQTAGIEETTSYLNDTNLWVLGLPQQVTNVATGEVESANTYATNDTLLTRSAFGQTLMSYTFNSAGQLASFTDSNTKTTSLGNYKRGIPQTINYPDGTSETLVVDDFGQITRINDQAGHGTAYSYDPVGRITGINYPGSDEVAWTPETFSYSFVTGAERGVAANHWKRTSTLGGANTVTYFDAMLRPVLSDSALGSTVQSSTLTTYDSKGQKLFSSYPSATALAFTQSPAVAGSSTTYDALGRATQVQQTSELGTLTSSTSYGAGASQVVTDSKGNVTTTHYQVFDEPSYDSVIRVDAPTGITQTIARDVYGNPLSITQSGLYGTQSNSLTKTLTYDSYHRLCRSTEPESGSEVMAYDAANNLAWSASGLAITGTGCGQEQVAAAARTSRTYDAMNRLKTLLPPTGTQSTSYGYDPVGRMTSAVSGISTWTGTYNFRGLLTGESLQLVGQNPWVLGYTHDANGHLSAVHYPDGENVSYAPDALGRPTQVGSYANSVGYFPNGQVAQFVYEGGAGYVAEQNARQLLSNFSYGPGSTAQLSEDLVYDKNANITTVTDLAGGPRNKSYGYDVLNRLTSAAAAGLWGSQAYSYDALNNLRTLQTGSQVATYTYDASNKLTGISGALSASYTYDPRGNVATKNATSLVFDQKNQLTQIGTDAYAYDASGRRVRKTTGGVTTYYFYNQAGQLMYQWVPSTAQATDFIYLGSRMVGDNESVALGAPATIGFDVNPNNGSYTVSWGAVAAATSYTLQESANGGTWTTVYSGTATSSTLSGKAGGSYIYRAEGCIGSTCGAFTSSATLGVTPALPTVTVPTGTINGTYTVSWSAPASATAYTVQENLNGGAWTTIASNTTAASISRPGTTSGSYTYQVSASNASGTRGWAASAAVTVDTTYGVVPPAPATLTVPATSTDGNATLSWSAASLATRYAVQQSSNGGTSWTGIYDSTGTSTAVSGLADGSYVFQVQACDTYGCSPWKAGSATLAVGHVPVAPASVTVPATSSGSVTVSWPSATYATGYNLQQRLGTGAWSTVYTGAALSKALNVTASGSYTYQVQSTNSHGSSVYKVSSAVTVTIPPAGAPSLTVPATSTTGSYTVSWGAVTAATSYTLQEQVGGGAWATIQSSSALSKAISGKGNGTYGYRVQACNAGGCGAWSGVGSIIVTLIPSTPDGPYMSLIGPFNKPIFDASWGAVTGATSYTLQENKPRSTVYTTLYSGANTSYDALLGTGTGPMYFRVEACNAVGCSSWSSNVLLTP
jgi:YD repeat-containing protein